MGRRFVELSMPILQVEIVGKPEAVAGNLARAVGRACARPTEIYDPPGEGRAAFGGELLEK